MGSTKMNSSLRSRLNRLERRVAPTRTVTMFDCLKILHQERQENLNKVTISDTAKSLLDSQLKAMAEAIARGANGSERK